METSEQTEQYHQKWKRLMDEYAHLVYRLTKTFPKEELYGITSQLRRAVLSVVLNYIEGYARRRDRVYTNFFKNIIWIFAGVYIFHTVLSPGRLYAEVAV